MPGTPTASQVVERVGEVVRLLKQVGHIADRDIAEAVGISRSVAQQRVSGMSKWTTGEVYLLAEFFGVPVSLLFRDPREAVLSAIRDYDVQHLRNRLPER